MLWLLVLNYIRLMFPYIRLYIFHRCVTSEYELSHTSARSALIINKILNVYSAIFNTFNRMAVDIQSDHNTQIATVFS